MPHVCVLSVPFVYWQVLFLAADARRDAPVACDFRVYEVDGVCLVAESDDAAADAAASDNAAFR